MIEFIYYAVRMLVVHGQHLCSNDFHCLVTDRDKHQDIVGGQFPGLLEPLDNQSHRCLGRVGNCPPRGFDRLHFGFEMDIWAQGTRLHKKFDSRSRKERLGRRF